MNNEIHKPLAGEWSEIWSVFFFFNFSVCIKTFKEFTPFSLVNSSRSLSKVKRDSDKYFTTKMFLNFYDYDKHCKYPKHLAIWDWINKIYLHINKTLGK